MASKLVKVIRKPDDPICCRASIGGNKEGGFYLVFRNNPKEVLEAIDEAREALAYAIEHDIEMDVEDE